VSVRVIEGDCRAVLAALPAESVHCVVTSPPYWGLRDYGIEPGVWPAHPSLSEGGSGDPACAHEWASERVNTEIGKGNWAQGINGRGEMQPGGVDGKREPIRASSERAFCRACGAWRGAHGLEPTLDLYVAHAVEAFRAVRRMLRKDGTLWLNLGDSYNAAAGGRQPSATGKHGYWQNPAIDRRIDARRSGLKPKDLCMVPARIALALQADGWWLRSEIVWAKPNPMPESITDRPTSAHEKVFLLSKSARYFYNAEAVRETGIEPERQRSDRIGGANGHLVRHSPGGMIGASKTRNVRNVWMIATAPFTGAHFATFPPALVERCIKAGCPPGDTVLDPFGGAGTVGLVADRLGRDAILIELNRTYCDMARKRIVADAPLLSALSAPSLVGGTP